MKPPRHRGPADAINPSSNLDQLMADTVSLREQEKELQARIAANKADLAAAFKARRVKGAYVKNGLKVYEVHSHSSKLSVEKLIDLGVGADTITKATTTSKFSYVRVDVDKAQP